MSLDPVFPHCDPVGPDAEAISPDLHVVSDILVPNAAATDRHGVRRETMDRLAASGLLGVPLQPQLAQRELAEVLAGCDATTWFCWAQHYTPLKTLEDASTDSQLRERLLPDLRSGRQLAAVAFAHVRRPGPPNPLASRVPGGWRVSGTLDWVTSWDIADVMLLMVQGDGADASSLISAFVPAGHGRERVPGLEPGLPLALMAMAGTHTRPLVLTDVFLPDESIARIADREAWLSADAAQSANANPSAFGVARGAIAELDLIARLRSDSAIAGLTEALVDECRAVRRRAYALADDPKTSVDERLSVRAAALDHVLRATTAVVIARAGAAMRAGHDAERRVREALFLQVQAQTAASRSVSLDTLTARSRRGVADLG